MVVIDDFGSLLIIKRREKKIKDLSRPADIGHDFGASYIFVESVANENIILPTG